MYNAEAKIYLKGNGKYVAFSNLNIYVTWKSIKKSYKIKFILSRAASSEEFERSNGSYSVANNQGYFEYIIKKQDALTVDPPIQN